MGSLEVLQGKQQNGLDALEMDTAIYALVFCIFSIVDVT